MKKIFLFLSILCFSFALSVEAAKITIGSIEAGSTLEVNGSSVSEGNVLNFTNGDTVTFSTTFNGKNFEDVIESHYDITVDVHAKSYSAHPGSPIYLDASMDYTPYDIFIIDSSVDTQFEIDMLSDLTNDAAKIIGLHLMVPDSYIGDLASSSHTGTPPNTAEIFYGTVESSGYLYINTTCSSEMGSVFNKIVADKVEFESGCSDDSDIMIQELRANYAETDDTEISWWRMELRDKFYCDDFDGYSLNDELPEMNDLTSDAMLWFKARNPAKWNLYPLIKIDGTGDAWDFDNYDYEDYNFWETHLGGAFKWYNDDDYNEYVHFLGPVVDIKSLSWSYYNEDLYINFFGDDNNNYSASDRFDGDYGSAGQDFWNPLLTTASPNGYGYTDGSIVSPVFILKLRDGTFHTEDNYSSYETYFYLADNQDLLILSDDSTIDFYCDDGCSFNTASNSHWVVEDGLNYINSTPTDNAFSINIISFEQNGNTVTIEASNDYAGGITPAAKDSNISRSIGGSGDSNVSTMYVAYRLKTDYGQQLTKVSMDYDSNAGSWSTTVNLPSDKSGEYYFVVVATENDGNYGKAVELDASAYYAEEEPEQLYPVDNETGVSLTPTFQWQITGVSDDDSYYYYLYVCENQDFVDCAPEYINTSSNINAQANVLYSGGFAKLPMLGIILLTVLSFILALISKRFKRLFSSLMVIGLIIISGCEFDGDGVGVSSASNTTIEEYTLQNTLKPNTLYYWKVMADDGKGQVTESPVKSFTTGS